MDKPAWLDLVSQVTATAKDENSLTQQNSVGYLRINYMWHLNASPVYRQDQQDVIEATSPHVNVETIKNFSLTLPSLQEQREISGEINSRVSKLDKLIAKVHQVTTCSKNAEPLLSRPQSPEK